MARKIQPPATTSTEALVAIWISEISRRKYAAWPMYTKPSILARLSTR
jgi:hypothetical protein